MKRIALLAGLLLSLCSASRTEAQVRVRINLGAPVASQNWFDQDQDYYFLPGPGVYYNVRRRVYVYPENGAWLYARRLPERFGACSFENTRYYRVRDYHPFWRHDYYRNQYRNDSYNRGYRHERGWSHEGYGGRNSGWQGRGHGYGDQHHPRHGNGWH
ncbi:MAG: hypothetical protein JST06_00950 [Bacteroidetes bacterium]|nr:hypothetical protein [Bacteroidota bacterium]MBS1630163.1 hypothetical protein [Bacteroidota bacterium]